MSRFSKLSLVAVMTTLVAAGCTERPPRSFVQPNVLKKSDLTGVWYYAQTVLESQAVAGQLFAGLSPGMMKIKFDVEEGTLYARRAYEHVAGSEDSYAEDPASYFGQPLAAWRITSHFDIIRDFNPMTGEETNRIIESTERPWNEREFIRVDWSESLITDNEGVGLWFLFDDIQPESVPFWESDPTKPDAIRLERAAANDEEFDQGEANYLDVTNKLLLKPKNQTITYEEGGQQGSLTYPACFFRYNLDDCATEVVKIRHSFAKISPKHQYEPRKWDGPQMDLFGYFTTENSRLSYHRQYGITNSGIQRYMNRFNLWKKSYQEDGKTPIPYAAREQRTIPYYAMSTLEPFPPELFDLGGEVIRQWNEAVKVAVADVTGKPIAQVQEVFVWCHNPVKQNEDPEACKQGLQPERDAKGNVILDADGNPMLMARKGDPRRSMIFWIHQTQAGPLGYGPSMSDPQTGESISARSMIYGAALDSYAANARDMVLLASGRLDPREFVDGINVREWVDANKAGTKDARLQTFTTTDVKAMASAMDFRWARGQAPEAPIDRSSPDAFLKSIGARQQAMHRAGVFGQGNADLAQIRRDKLRDSVLEGMMITSDHMMMAGGARDWTALSPAEKARISPLRSQAVRREIEYRMNKLRAVGVDFADFMDQNIIQRAIKLANDPEIQNMDPERIRQALRRDIFLGVTLHEVGHNVGLRHNFRASFDAMNYFPQYWELRDKARTSRMAYAGFDPNTGQAKGEPYPASNPDCTGRAGKLGPRYLNCPGHRISVEEVNGGQQEYQYSSIMEYGSDFNADFYGLGKYDKAAMKFGYAGNGFVEVFTNAKFDNNAQIQWASLHAFAGAFGFPSPLTLTGGWGSINYYNYPDLFEDGYKGLEERLDVPLDALVNKPWENPNKRTVGDFIAYDDQDRPMVPYYFCSDEFVGNLTCQRFDSGADAYEQASDLISRYHNYYLLNNFKRDRYRFFTSLGYYSRISDRYLEMLREQMTWYTLLRSNFSDTIDGAEAQEVRDFFSNPDGWGSFTAAVERGFNLVGQILMTPNAGSFTPVARAQSNDLPFDYYKFGRDDLSGGAGATVIGLLDGKFGETTWDFDRCGYYWADECQTRIGYFIDKTIALDVLSQSQAYFTGRDTTTDVRRYAIGYYRIFKQQVQEKLGAMLAGDLTSLAPRLVPGSTPGTASVAYPDWALDNKNFQTPDTRPLIDPAGGFTLNLYAGVYAMSAFPSGFDNDFVDTTRIFVVGNGEAPVPDSQILGSLGTTNPDDSAGKYYTFSDPVSGKTYAARIFPKSGDGGSGSVYRQDTGVRMLDTLAKLNTDRVAACAAPSSIECSLKTTAFNNYKSNIDVMRSLHHKFGYAHYKTDAPFVY
jgi:hypothetical protein